MIPRLILASACLAAPAAFALTINPTWDTTITSDSNAAAIEAGIMACITELQNSISTNTTVNITFRSMGSGLGQSATNYVTTSYSSYTSALTTSSSGDTTDVSALASLGSGSNDPVIGGSNIKLTTALARALGLYGGTGTDSTISINTSSTNFDRTTIDPLKYDLQSVVMHEMDEVLGLSSSLQAGSGTLPTTINAMDLFRYSAANTRSFAIGTGVSAYLSVNAGATLLAQFNQDGSGDYGDYKSISGTPRVQDAYGTPGTHPDLGSNELTSLDAVGWTLTAVPEPGEMAAMPVFAAAVAVAVRRRRRSV